MLANVVLFWINALLLWDLTLAQQKLHCPENCVCSAQTMSIVCSCQTDDDLNWTPKPFVNSNEPTSANNYHLILEWSGAHQTKCRHFIVHSCARLTIRNDTFMGMEIIDRLQFVGIGHIEFLSHSFRGIGHSPKQIVIQDSHVEYVAPFAFTGISNVDHFWWRNVTVTTIAKMAFSKIYNINYFYFRNANIESLEAGAFGNLI